MLIDEDEESGPKEDKEFESEGEQEGDEIMKISISALTANLKHKTIRVLGIIKGRKISILIDKGSAHSFIDERLVRKLDYATKETRTMTVKVANGDKLESKAMPTNDTEVT